MWLVNLFTRKKTDTQATFRMFDFLYSLNPKVFFWIKPFPDKKGRYILLQFKHSIFKKYNGLEFVILDSQQITYYRLPGAKPNGKGMVSLGEHYAKFNSMFELEIYYSILKKKDELDLVLHNLSENIPVNNDYNYIPCRAFPYERFVSELQEIILYGLNWHYQNILTCSEQQIVRTKAQFLNKAVRDFTPPNLEMKLLINRIVSLLD